MIKKHIALSIIVFFILFPQLIWAQLTPVQEEQVKSSTEQYMDMLVRLAQNPKDATAFEALLGLFNDPSSNLVYHDLAAAAVTATAWEYLAAVRAFKGQIKFRFSAPFYYYQQITGRWHGMVKVVKQISGENIRPAMVTNVLAIDAETGKIGEIGNTLPARAIPFGSNPGKPQASLVTGGDQVSKAPVISNTLGKTYRNGEVVKEVNGLELVYVKGGAFIPGNSRNSSKKKVTNRIAAVNDFLIGKYEVTQEQWVQLMGFNPSTFNTCLRCPVENVDWYEAVEFCNKLSEQAGLMPYYTIDKKTKDPGNKKKKDIKKYTIRLNANANGYRLPTEIEWEYAAKGGLDTTTFVYSGDNDLNKVGWYKNNSNFQTHLVGQKQANKLGIHDMSGNVWEWCWDWFDKDYYKSRSTNHQTGPTEGTQRVIRGGSWFILADGANVNYRDGTVPYRHVASVGFRVVRSGN